MYPERELEPLLPPREAPPATPELSSVAETDPEVAAAYVAWRLGRPEDPR